MKVNWKVLVACLVIVGIIVWGVDTLRSRSYSGANLAFNVGGGAVTMKNPSTAPLAIQLVSPKAGAFSVTSPTEGLAGSSVKGAGGKVAQMFDIMLPVGSSEFTVVKGNGVNFVSATDTLLEAVVQPMSANDTRSTLIAIAVIIAASLFFISYTTDHQWINIIRGIETPVIAPIVESTDGGQGEAIRTYGDNRSR